MAGKTLVMGVHSDLGIWSAMYHYAPLRPLLHFVDSGYGFRDDSDRTILHLIPLTKKAQMKQKKKMTWNYRVGTKLIQNVFSKFDRVFSIVSVYYDSKLKPKSYGDHYVLANDESPKDLKTTHKLILGALKKPIIDLDNFPKIYKEGKNKK